MYDSVDKVFEIGLGVINKIRETQCEKLDEAGRLIARTHMNGHKFFVTGSGRIQKHLSYTEMRIWNKSEAE